MTLPRPSSHHRRQRWVTLLAAGALLLTACGGDGDQVDAADDPVRLRLLTHESFNVSDEVLQAFTEETGIEVQVLATGDAGTALNQAILTRETPQGDLLFGVDTTFLSRALDEELFVAYRSPELDRVRDDIALDEEGRVTPVDVGDVCLNYDRAGFEERELRVPTTLEDLTDAMYRDLLVVQNPASSSPGLAFLLATVEEFGEDGYLEYWTALRDNGVVVTDGWSEAYYGEFSGSGEGGDRPLVVSYASSPAAEVVFADPPLDAPPTGVIEASCVRQVEYVGILDGTPHEEEARQLLDFLLSRTFQEDVPLTMFVYPVVEDAELPEVFTEHAQPPGDPYVPDPFSVGDRREELIEAWTTAVLR